MSAKEGRCANCGVFGHSANDCVNKDKYWVVTQQQGSKGMVTKIATRGFLVIGEGTPIIMGAGRPFRQNLDTKQVIFQRSPFAPDGYSHFNHCLHCGKITFRKDDCVAYVYNYRGHLEKECPHKDEFWISTQDGKGAVEKVAQWSFIVIYMGQPVEIQAGQTYWQHPITKQVVVGWHGSVSPPYGMDGQPLPY